MYGLLERQFVRFYTIASKRQGETGLALLQLLEKRLDNVMYRSGFAKTRDQARQLVNHGHVKVNGKKLSIPSYIVEEGDKITLDAKIYDAEWFGELRKINETYQAPSWLSKVDATSVEVVGTPVREDIDPGINEQYIVEFYSK
jgi:small subunit ribosomal protein S4